MSKKKTIHIISHTHWDREWYLPYEKHHYLLVQTIDQLLDTLATDPNFKSFHLDGQTIILEDYLQVRPEKREQIKMFIEAGRIQVGPWYILQDEFLTSSEANVRNLQYGMRDARKWGGLSKIGYFPDSFGNIGQAPQILKQAGIRAAAFGRGVKPTGFNNAVIDADEYESPYSEMKWQSPDGTEVTGILFANWYCNGNEIPVDEEKARKYWKQHIENLEKFASTSQMLMLNGCDHQPIQTNLSEAIEVANQLYPDYQFIHSSFNEYVESLEKESSSELKVVKGELRSQKTDGWGTLVNTASSRVYLKQMNQKVQTLLEKIAEPLATFCYLHDEHYDHDLFSYAWKTLMQNHPHDSICGCSVDEVHDEMVTRFKKSEHFTEMMINQSVEHLVSAIDTSVFKHEEPVYPFVVFNTTATNKTEVTEVIIDLARQYYRDGVNKKALQAIDCEGYIVIDEANNKYPVAIKDHGLVFDYDLPLNQFRQPYMARRVTVRFETRDLPELGYKTFALIKGETSNNTLVIGKQRMENKHLIVDILDNGSFNLTDKQSGHCHEGLNVYEDTGDIGNEYMYKATSDCIACTTENETASIELIDDTPVSATYKVTHHWSLPEGAADTLDHEQREWVWFTKRDSDRALKEVAFTIETMITLTSTSKYVDVKTNYNNTVKDHRLRVLFPTKVKANYHYSDSVFEIAKRSNKPSEQWENPDYSQHQQVFVDLSDENQGLCIANKGLNEYEILQEEQQKIAITLLRAVGEMGDWGYFPTPKAQCLDEQMVEYRIIPHGGGKERFKAYQTAYQFQVPSVAKETKIQTGTLPTSHSFIQLRQNETLSYSSLKVSEETGDVMLRFANLDEKSNKLTLNTALDCYRSDVIERQHDLLVTKQVELVGFEILTVGIRPK
ncbi:alpha-mannosidase [Amphibacillus jilinensis]|uniref:alpha-mannosidase n=1 Tax=Amphibacillus jilinensis TaxID=1216008 RepID=UPI00031F6943|nr:alpha-mannosidase [Amphibacillus jilinensis]